MQLQTSDIEGLVTWTLIRSAHHVERRLTELFAAFGLTPVQFGVLAHLNANEALTQAQLAQQILIRPQSMSELLDGLVERELLVRTGLRGRGRPNPIALSAAGRALLAAVWPAVRTVNSPAPLGLSEAESSELNRLLHRVLESSGSA